MLLKVLTWNINRAAHTRETLWNYLGKLNVDVAMLQEVYVIPYEIRRNYHITRGEMNAILINNNLSFETIRENAVIANTSNLRIMDAYISWEGTLFDKAITFISVYNYMLLELEDFSEFLRVLYKYLDNNKDKRLIIIGGDFNMDAEFIKNKSFEMTEWGHLAEKMYKRLYELGYKEVVYESNAIENFTYIAPFNKKVYKLDHLFVPETITSINVRFVNKEEIFGQKPRISDHLPIIATVEI